MSAFAKCYVTGPGAEAWLDSILANRIPKKVGRIGLCHLLSTNGGVRSEFTVYRTGAGGLLSRLRRRAGSATTTTSCRSCCPPTAASASIR